MRKLKLLIALCMVTIAASASKTVYLAPSDGWKSDGARFALYMFTGSDPGVWTDFVAVTGAEGIYSAEFDETYESMLFGRMNPGTTENNFNDGVKWNQTGNLAAPAASGLLYTLGDGWDNPTVTVSIYGATPATFTDGGKYLFKNVGSGKYMAPGSDWGTRASLIAPTHFNTAHYVSEGKYKIESQVSNGGTSYFLGLNNESKLFLDNGGKDINITNIGNDVFVMNFADESEYIGYDGTNKPVVHNLALTDPNAQWEIVPCETVLNSATMDNPVDATFLVLCQNFDRNHRSSGAWTMVANNQNLCGGKNENKVAESWHSSNGFTLSQTITVPNGFYKVCAQAAYGDADITDGTEPVVYATGSNEATVKFFKMTDSSGGMDAFSDRFLNNEYTTAWSDLVTVTNKSITVGVKCTRTDTWSIWDNIQLKYYGPLDLSGYVAAYETALANAKTMATTASSVKVSATLLAALNTAINTYEKGNVDETDQDALETATDALDSARENVERSIASYAELLAAINNANNTYPTAFEAGETIFNNAVAAAQAVYDAAEVDDCAEAIATLTNGIHAAYEADYNTFATDYEYDYSTLLSNDLTQWASSDYVVMNGNQHWNGSSNAPYYEQSGTDWGSQSWEHNASETATLPAGKYVMSITARSSAYVTQTMKVKIGDNDAITVALAHKGDSGRGVTTAGVGSFADGNTYTNNNNGRGWEYRFIAFELTEESQVTISFNSSTVDHIQQWCSIAAPLLKGNVHPNQIKLNQVHTLKATLVAYENSISAETYATFANDIAAAEAATLESTNLDDIIAALHADIETAKAEKAEFDRGAAMNALNTGDNSVVLTDEATRDNWTPAPEKNTWSTEADNTGMVTPFLQNWQAKENGGLPDNTETYVPIRGLKKGYYEVSALVRIYSESGNEPSATSATFTVNGTSVSLLDGTHFDFGNNKGIYKTVSVIVNTEDALNISLAYSGANFNWIAWKNLQVTYLFETPVPVYAVAGSAPFFSGNWDQATRTDILDENSGVYTKTYADQELEKQTIEYKVIKKDYKEAQTASNWYDNNTNANLTISIPVKGKYDITFKFTEEGSVVTGVATKTAEAVTIGTTGWATTVTNSALNFASSGVEAYTATVANDEVSLKKVDDVQAETGLVLKGAKEAKTYYIPVIASSTTDKGSLLFSSTESYWTWHNNGGENNKFYGLALNGNNDAQFTQIACSAGNEVEIPAGKAFLLINSASAARTLKVVFAGEATGIDAIAAENTVEGIYNINGQRVAAPVKGLYIVNGKKVILK